MIFGMSLATYTLIHVAISFAGIVSGLVVVYGMLSGKQLNGWTAFFLLTTVATSVTGFGFPFHGVNPPIIVGIISIVVLAIAILARYVFRLAGSWRWIYVVSAIAALYFNVFELVVQSFEKFAPLRALAPTQKEPPFAVAQLLVLAMFIFLGVKATKNFRAVTIAPLPAMPATP